MVRLVAFTMLLAVCWCSVLEKKTTADESDVAVPSPDRSAANIPPVSAADVADASQKWFITVLVGKDCRFCTRMLSDFAGHPDLRVFVHTEDHRKSWANWNVCSMDDPKQAARFKPPHSDLKIKGYPTLLVQPPTSGTYGSAHTIVLQKTGYDGDASKLAQQLKTSIQRYAAAAGRSTSPEAIANRTSASRPLR